MTPCESRKRSLASTDPVASFRSKRQRTNTSHTIFSRDTGVWPDETRESASNSTADEMAKKGLRRSVAMVMKRIGFESAQPAALESFVRMAEIYFESLANDVQQLSAACRRTSAIPTDFERSLRRFNLTITSLKPHLKPPVHRSKREPAWHILPDAEGPTQDLPILGTELDGAQEKTSREFIPKSFPSFPSLHTYRYTEVNVEAATAWEDTASQVTSVGNGNSQGHVSSFPGSFSDSQVSTRPLAPHEIPHGDPKKMREAAAKEAKYGEDALRRLMRQAKIAKQKDLRAVAEREEVKKERYELWEKAMLELIDEQAGTGAGAGMRSRGPQGDAAGRIEIADHSMIVNSEKRFHRKEAPKTGKRKVAGS